MCTRAMFLYMAHEVVHYHCLCEQTNKLAYSELSTKHEKHSYLDKFARNLHLQLIIFIIVSFLICSASTTVRIVVLAHYGCTNILNAFMFFFDSFNICIWV